MALNDRCVRCVKGYQPFLLGADNPAFYQQAPYYTYRQPKSVNIYLLT
jgi:hypothetical protein